MTEHEHWEELAAGYALHGLAPDEEVLFLDHLASCEDCTASLKDHELVAAQLGSIAHYRDPEEDAPTWESMRPSILSGEVDDRLRADPPKLLPASVLAGSPNLVDLAERRNRRYTTSRRLLAAAAALVVVAGGGVTVWQLSSNGGSGTTAVAGACSASADCHIVTLDASPRHKVASLVVRGRKATLTTTNMRAAPAGDVYVLWQLTRDNSPEPIGKFTASHHGQTSTTSLTSAYSDTQEFAISLESAASRPSSPHNVLAYGQAV